mmetsp:Transcript_30741/g.40876  ORF Transcript_30741/g.40876 Transcript_30741/m.40876 type:complete len:128 (-) Transcript_30741:175-558(-)
MIAYGTFFNFVLAFLSICCMLAAFSPTFFQAGPKVALFSTFAFFVLVPTLVLYYLNDAKNSLAPGDAPFGWCTLPYAIGFSFYLSSFPECCSKKGTFDNLGQSHNLHHLCVLVGIALALIEAVKVYE